MSCEPQARKTKTGRRSGSGPSAGRCYIAIPNELICSQLTARRSPGRCRCCRDRRCRCCWCPGLCPPRYRTHPEHRCRCSPPRRLPRSPERPEYHCCCSRRPARHAPDPGNHQGAGIRPGPFRGPVRAFTPPVFTLCLSDESLSDFDFQRFSYCYCGQ